MKHQDKPCESKQLNASVTVQKCFKRFQMNKKSVNIKNTGIG